MIIFPTGKPHVSYSEVRNWKECPFRHKLLYIDKVYMFSPSPFLSFGTAVHEGCESYLKTQSIDRDEILNKFRESWRHDNFDDPQWIQNQPGWYKHAPLEEWCNWANNMWDDLPAFLDKEFPDWECVSAEEMLYEDIDTKDLKFKGFIDAIIKVPGKGKKKDKYWVVDWKTANAGGWHGYKRRDVLTHVQLFLYKHYWSLKNNVPSKDVGCAFALLKRGAKPGKTCDIFKVSAGPKSMEKAVKIVNSMISSVKKGFFVKNRNSCKFCDYHGTEHCP